jgi:uncharacterized tellurite resistance protein B-like protein
MIKLVLIIIILLAIAAFRIIRAVVRTVSNELPFWTDAAGKILNDFLEEDNGSNPNNTRNTNFQYRPEFSNLIDKQVDAFGNFIDRNCKTTLDTFLFLEFCISIHMAKADGVIDNSEIEGIRSYFKETYGDELDESLLAKASPMVREFIQTYTPDELILSACISLDVWFEVLKGTIEDEETRTEFIFQIFGFVYQVALMDGILQSSETRFFKGICDYFHLDREAREYIERVGEYQFNARKNRNESVKESEKEIENALKLFQLNGNYTKEELQKAWKNYAKLNHPDKFHSVDRGIYEKINAQFLEAKKGYDLLLSRVDTKVNSPFVEPEPTKEPYQEKPQEPTPEYEEEKPQETYSSSAKVERETVTPEYVQPAKPSVFWSELGKQITEIVSILKKSFSPDSLKLVFFGSKSRAAITVGIPIVVILGFILVPIATESYYKRLLKNDSSADYKKAYNYYYLQGNSSIDTMKDVYKNASSNIEKTNALHALVDLGDTSTDTLSYVIEMLGEEDRVALQTLENISTMRFTEEAIYNSLLSLLKRKNTLLKERTVRLLSKKGISSVPVTKENLEIFMLCKGDSISSVSKFCLEALKPFAREERVREFALLNLKSSSDDLKNYSWELLLEGINSENDLDELIATNKNHPLPKILLSEFTSHQNEILSLASKNPKFFKSNFSSFSKFLRTKSENEMIDFLGVLGESIQKEDYLQKFLRDYAGDKSDEFKSVYAPSLVTATIMDQEKKEQEEPKQPTTFARVREPSGLFLRDRCSMNGGKLVLIPDGEQVEVIARDKEDLLYEISNHWYRIRYKGLVGCSFGGFLEF